MSIFSIKFQTAELVPPPFSHAIEVKGKFVQNQEIEIVFEQTYLGRELISVEEIQEEGFTENDNFTINQTLPMPWFDLIFGSLKSSKPLKIKELADHQEFWEIEFEGKEFYPSDAENWKYILEELQQALLEKAQIEKPLKLTFLKNSDKENFEITITGSFVNRNLEVLVKDLLIKESHTKFLDWKELNYILKNAFSGDFLEEKAIQHKPTQNGIFINIGDDNWFESGNSWIINHSKIKNILKYNDFS